MVVILLIPKQLLVIKITVIVKVHLAKNKHYVTAFRQSCKILTMNSLLFSLPMFVQLQTFQIFKEGFKYVSLTASISRTSRNPVIHSIEPQTQIRIHTVCHSTPTNEEF